jgi:hypothetical protein
MKRDSVDEFVREKKEHLDRGYNGFYIQKLGPRIKPPTVVYRWNTDSQLKHGGLEQTLKWKTCVLKIMTDMTPCKISKSK